MIIHKLKQWWHSQHHVWHDPLVEGMYAHQYPEEDAGGPRATIRNAYRQRWQKPSTDPTPATHPWMFDPCDPPEGWVYDPFYEVWIKS